MKYLLACRVNGETLYLSETGSLTTNKSDARVFLNRSNAEGAAEKYRRPRPRARVDQDRPKLYQSPVREE
jgi:hypothetical protein